MGHAGYVGLYIRTTMLDGTDPLYKNSNAGGFVKKIHEPNLLFEISFQPSLMYTDMSYIMF